MSDAKIEIAERVDTLRKELTETLQQREEMELAIQEIESTLRERHEKLQRVCGKEGELRGAIGDLERAREAL